MPFDINPITGLSREIREWLDRRDRGEEKRNVAVKTAMSSLSTAVLQTRRYIQSFAEGEYVQSMDPATRDRNDESRLSDLWNKAQVDIATLDPDLAARCFLKAEY